MLKCCGTCKHGGRVTETRKITKTRYAQAAAIKCELANFSTPVTEVCPRWEANKNI